MSTSLTAEFNGLQAPPVYVMRGVPSLLDEDVAAFFGETTSRLNEQVKRNQSKFGDDFAFQLTAEEWADLKSQSAISSSPGHGGRRKPPRMFTEHGVVMAATVLRSDRAVAASRFIVSIFVEARRSQLLMATGRNSAMVSSNALLTLAAEARHGLMAKLDATLGRVLDAIADPETGTTIRDEARAVAAEGLSSIKEHLRKAGVQNDKTNAQAHKLLREAEAIDAEIASRHIENRHRQLAYLAKQLRLVIEIQQFLDTGSVEGLVAVLKDMGGA
jgi:hypothetical protein